MAHIIICLFIDPTRIYKKLQTNIFLGDRSFLQLWSKNSAKEGIPKV
jgi:hypothetical protein